MPVGSRPGSVTPTASSPIRGRTPAWRRSSTTSPAGGRGTGPAAGGSGSDLGGGHHCGVASPAMTDESSGPLRVADDQRVRTFTLDRPDALNAFNEELYDALAE